MKIQIEKSTCIRIAVTIFLLFLAIHYWDTLINLVVNLFKASTPIFLGLTIAYVLNILMTFYESHYFSKHLKLNIIKKSRRIVCMLLAIITFIAILAFIIRLVIPELILCFKILFTSIPPAIEQLLTNEYLSKILSENTLKTLSAINWSEYAQKIAEILMGGIGNATETIFHAISSILSSLVTLFISIIFSIYLLLDKEKLQNQIKRVMNATLPNKWNTKITNLSSILNNSFHKYIVGQGTEAIVLGILCIVGMLIFRFPHAVMIGTLIGFTALIPIAGAYIGAAIGAVMIFTVSPLQALLFILFIIVLQQLEGNLIYPKIVGKSIGLPALWVLSAITIGGGLMGIGGMLLGVPIASTLYRIVKENIHNKEALLNK